MEQVYALQQQPHGPWAKMYRHQLGKRLAFFLRSYISCKYWLMVNDPHANDPLEDRATDK